MKRDLRCPVLLAVWLPLIALTVHGDTNRMEGSALNQRSEYFGAHHTVMSWDTGIGFADNVTLVPNDEKSDLFAVLRAKAEYRRQFAGGASLYVNTSLERTQYVQESDASELFADAFGEYMRDFETWAWGVSDALSYEDYRSFDEEGGVLPSGKYEAMVNKTRLFGSWFFAANHELEAGISWRIKNYLDADRDFDETGVDFTHRWKISKRWGTNLGGSYRTQDYAAWQALSADGTLASTNPTEAFDIMAFRGGVTRELPHKGRAYITVRHVDYDENFQDEASYDEIGIDAGAVVAVGRDYVVEMNMGASGRDYSTRTGESGRTREDDVLTLTLAVERRLAGTTSAYLLIDIGNRDSTDPNEDYRDNAVTIGLRGVL